MINAPRFLPAALPRLYGRPASQADSVSLSLPRALGVRLRHSFQLENTRANEQPGQGNENVYALGPPYESGNAAVCMGQH